MHHLVLKIVKNMNTVNVKEEFSKSDSAKKLNQNDEISLYEICDGFIFGTHCSHSYNPNPFEILKQYFVPTYPSVKEAPMPELGTGERLLSQPPTFEPGIFSPKKQRRLRIRSKEDLTSN